MSSAYQGSCNHLLTQIISFFQWGQSIKSINMLRKPFPVSSPSLTPTFLPKAIIGCLQKGAVNVINLCKLGMTPVCFLAVRLVLNCSLSCRSSYPYVVVNLLPLLTFKCFRHSHFLLCSCLWNTWVSDDIHSTRPFLIAIASSTVTDRLLIVRFSKVRSTNIMS